MTFFRFINDIINEKIVPPTTSNPTPKAGVLRHAPTPTNVIRNGRRHVRASATPSLINQRGWTNKDKVWRGSYVSRFGTFQGQIELRSDTFEVMIRKPPEEITRHQKFVCFHKRANGWWSIHLHTPPRDKDPSAVLRYVEQLLEEAFKHAPKL